MLAVEASEKHSASTHASDVILMVVRIGLRCEEDSMTDFIQIHGWGMGWVRGVGRRMRMGGCMGWVSCWVSCWMMSSWVMSSWVMSCCVAINLASFLIAWNAFLLWWVENLVFVAMPCPRDRQYALVILGTVCWVRHFLAPPLVVARIVMMIELLSFFSEW